MTIPLPHISDGKTQDAWSYRATQQINQDTARIDSLETAVQLLQTMMSGGGTSTGTLGNLSVTSYVQQIAANTRIYTITGITEIGEVHQLYLGGMKLIEDPDTPGFTMDYRIINNNQIELLISNEQLANSVGLYLELVNWVQTTS